MDGVGGGGFNLVVDLHIAVCIGGGLAVLADERVVNADRRHIFREDVALGTRDRIRRAVVADDDLEGEVTAACGKIGVAVVERKYISMRLRHVAVVRSDAVDDKVAGDVVQVEQKTCRQLQCELDVIIALDIGDPAAVRAFPGGKGAEVDRKPVCQLLTG